MEFPLLHFTSRATRNALTFKRGNFSSFPTGGTKIFLKDQILEKMILQTGTSPNVLPMMLYICVGFWLLAHESS